MSTNKRFTLITAIVFGLIIVAGIVCLTVAPVGGIGFSSAKTVSIENKLLTYEDFSQYLKDCEEEQYDMNIRYARRQIVTDGGYEQIAIYDYYGLSEEQVQQLNTLLTNQASIVYTIGDLDTTAYENTMLLLTIGAGVIILIQLGYYWIFARFTGKVATAFSTTIVTLSSLAVTLGIMCILGIVGIRIVGNSFVAVMLSVVSSVVANLIIMERLGAKQRAGQDRQEAIVNMRKETKTALTVAFLLGLVASVILSAIGGFFALSVSLSCCFALLATFASVNYLLLPMWLRLSK